MEIYHKHYKSATPKKIYQKLCSDSNSVVSTDKDGEEFVMALASLTGTFYVTAITKEDFKSRGFDASKLTDAEMQRIADKMGESMCTDGIYWDLIDFYAGQNNL